MEVESYSFSALSTMEKLNLAIEAAKTSEGKGKMSVGGLSIASKESKIYKGAYSF